MFKVPRSKTFWTFATSTAVVAGVVASDRYRLHQIRTALREEASQLGLQPASEQLRKVTLVLFGKDAEELRKAKSQWKSYAVDLFTLAGCDYQIFESNADAINKQVDKLMPVPDGTVPPPSDKPVERVTTLENWIIPIMNFWICKLNNKLDTTIAVNGQLLEKTTDEQNVDQQVESIISKLRTERRPEPKSKDFFKDGIIALDMQTFKAMEKTVQEHENTSIVRPRLEYLPCDPSPSFGQTILNFFQKAKKARRIGQAALKILRE